MARYLLAGIVALALILSLSSDLSETPDWTVARCSLWASDRAPVLPPYTRTDVCVQDDSALSFAHN